MFICLYEPVCTCPTHTYIHILRGYLRNLTTSWQSTAHFFSLLPKTQHTQLQLEYSPARVRSLSLLVSVTPQRKHAAHHSQSFLSFYFVHEAYAYICTYMHAYIARTYKYRFEYTHSCVYFYVAKWLCVSYPSVFVFFKIIYLILHLLLLLQNIHS